jgi:hypothetical protein
MSASNDTQRYRPGNYPNDPQLALDMKTAYDQIYTLNEQAVLGTSISDQPALVSGTTTVTGSQNGIATGLASVTNVIPAIDSGSAGGSTDIVSARPNPTQVGRIDIFVWQSDGVTPSATARTIRWFAVGKRASSATSV